MPAPLAYLTTALGAIIFFHTLATLLTFALSRASAQRNGRVPQTTSWLRAVAIMAGEWWFALAAIALWPLGWLPQRSLSHTGCGPTIVLLHGFVANRSSMFALYWRLRRAGHHRLHPLNIGFRRTYGPIEEAGAFMGERLSRLLGENGGQGLVCIAHSMGGLVARSAQRQRPELSAMRLITIGTPHAGTELSGLSFSAAGADMAPGSAFLNALNRDGAGGGQVLSIESNADNIVFPCGTAKFGDTYRLFAGLGHIRLLFDAEVFTAIETEIRRQEGASAPPAF